MTDTDRSAIAPNPAPQGGASVLHCYLFNIP